MELAWLQEERAEMERMERERLEQEAKELEEIDDEAAEHDAAYWKEDGEDLFVRASHGSYEDEDGSDSQSIAVDPGMLDCDFVEDHRAITPSLEDIPEIPDLNSPTFAKALPPSPRSPSKFGYLQDTESSARKKVESEGVDHPLRTVQNAIRLELPARGRSRSPSRGPAGKGADASNGKKDARAKSADARRPATPSKDHRGRPQTPSKPHPEIPKDGRTTPSRGLAVVGFFKRSKKDDDKKRKEDEEKEKKKKSKKDGGGDKDKKGKHAKVLMRPRPMARPPTPPTPTPPPRTRPSGVQTQTTNGVQVTPIYNRFMRQPSPWFLEGQSQQQKSFAPQQQQQRA
ncbi:hypothetical protein CYLTODRAFT_83785 [Cylindrobasidium torrendii FP15055 ss-10]|uniref:Uncharacterized protein n=1 Tax=Cylindrobasidium torrendii FP15055 ss-10 TaxID=1314674 RepID=A0A0D7B5N0_9AGAR|nr:hypothetical protein CYLTODRAFT_83785 [Cylindrobasidium torrendii FP15055 ss-10]